MFYNCPKSASGSVYIVRLLIQVGTLQSVQSVQCCDATFILDDIIAMYTTACFFFKSVDTEKFEVDVVNQSDSGNTNPVISLNISWLGEA